MVTRTDQRGASAGGDVVAGDKITNTIHQSPVRPPGIVEQLLQKLQGEIAKNVEVRHTVESLQYFYERRAKDEIVGLEAKLSAGDRDEEYFSAIAKKEQFAKLLERWSLYSSAQEIFAYLLAGVEHQFSMFVHPQIGEFDKIEVNQLVDDRIVGPTITECGTTVFTLNHGLVMGMIYWLAEQCFVRWHK